MPFALFLPLPSLPFSAPRSSSRPPTCCTQAPDTEVLFSRLSHINKNLRKKASYQLAENATPETLSRLISLLSLADTDHRRAAVQTLGMSGLPALPLLLSTFCSTTDSTVRASCIKALAAMVLFFPQYRKDFSNDSLDQVQNLLDSPDLNDVVTKIATIGFLGTLASDMRNREGNIEHEGNERAVRMLAKVCDRMDMALAATAVGALAQVGQNGTQEKRDMVLTVLNELVKEEGGEEEGRGFLRQMAASHIEQLTNGTNVPR